MADLLTPELILRGYCAGIFPMADPVGRIHWFSPDPRCIFEFDRFHVPRTLRQKVRQGRFEVRFSTAYDAVIAACCERPEGTWISTRIRRAYCELHRLGYAHSVEAWQAGELVGGLYGVAIGGAFFGESMFHRVTDASKVALVSLVERLQERGYALLDTQWKTQHLRRFGALEIPRDEYLRRLAVAIELRVTFVDAPG